MSVQADKRLTERTTNRQDMIEALLKNASNNGAEPSDVAQFRAELEVMSQDDLEACHTRTLG